jgi:hypothetical protein
MANSERVSAASLFMTFGLGAREDHRLEASNRAARIMSGAMSIVGIECAA